jgi:hypothetical protein
MGRVILPGLVAAALLVPAAATAQNQWQRTVRNQVSEHDSFLSQRGYTLSGDVYDGSLNHGEYQILTITVRPGTSYAFMGVCDEDCHDMDLRLYDPDGDEVDADVRTDDWPIVAVTPRFKGTYQVKVVMASCSRNPCYYGIGVFTK